LTLSPHEQYLEQYEKVMLKDTGDVLSLGFPSLDSPLGYSGLPLDTLFYIYAKSGVGKTYVITNLIVKLMEQRRKVVFFSFEMAYRKVMDRLLQLLFEKHFSEIPELVRQNSDMVRMRLQEKGFFDLVKIYNRPMTIDEIDGVIAEQKADIYFVDHLHLVKSPYAGVYEKTTHISNGLRDLKSKHNTRIMCLVQLRREGYVKGQEKVEAGAMLPTLEMGRGSGDIEADADAVLGLSRPEVSVNCKESHKSQLHGLYLKRRDSSKHEPRIIVLHFNRVTSALREEWQTK
jgi:replicative DNA helicase